MNIKLWKSKSTADIRCVKCGGEPRATLTDQCPHCGAPNYGQPVYVKRRAPGGSDGESRLVGSSPTPSAVLLSDPGEGEVDG